MNKNKFEIPNVNEQCSAIDEVKSQLRYKERELFRKVVSQVVEDTITFDNPICCTIHRASDEGSIYAAIYSIYYTYVNGVLSFDFDACEYEGGSMPHVELDDFMTGELNFLTGQILQQVSDGKIHFKRDGQI